MRTFLIFGWMAFWLLITPVWWWGSAYLYLYGPEFFRRIEPERYAQEQLHAVFKEDHSRAPFSFVDRMENDARDRNALRGILYAATSMLLTVLSILACRAPYENWYLPPQPKFSPTIELPAACTERAPVLNNGEDPECCGITT